MCSSKVSNLFACGRQGGASETASKLSIQGMVQQLLEKCHGKVMLCTFQSGFSCPFFVTELQMRVDGCVNYDVNCDGGLASLYIQADVPDKTAPAVCSALVNRAFE